MGLGKQTKKFLSVKHKMNQYKGIRFQNIENDYEDEPKAFSVYLRNYEKMPDDNREKFVTDINQHFERKKVKAMCYDRETFMKCVKD